MLKKTPLASAISTIVLAGSFAGVAAPVLAADDSSQSQPMEEVVVTGSRIKRTAHTESQEIITFTAEQMQLKGDVSVAEALRTSTMNTIGSFRESSGSSAQSNAVLDLRAMGSGRTLILLNGRRTVGSPSLGGGGTVNLNMIPFSAVDRVEVVADGASAIYGSDAIAGAVNIILKKNYEGMKFSARYGDRSEDNGHEDTASIMIGASSGKGRVTAALEWNRTMPIYDADRPYTKATWQDTNGDGYIEGYAETVGVSFYGYSLINPTYDSTKPFDPNDQTTWYISPGANCQEGVNGFAGPMKADQVFGPDSGFYCGYAYALVSANRAGLNRINTWVSSEYDLTDNVTVYADTLLSENSSFGRYAPPAASGPTIPGDPRNDVGATYGYFRWTDIGPRDNLVTDNLTDINVGLKGDISNGVSWDVHATYSSYTSRSIGNYYLSYSGLSYAIVNNVTDFATFVADTKASTVNQDDQNMKKLTAGLQFPLFSMEGGDATGYVGAEVYKIRYAALVDAQSEAGLVGGSAGNSATGDRIVRAVYGEAIFPFTSWASVNAAVRYDKYSDFGSATSPQIGATVYIPGMEQLKFHASWGKGFRAPNMSDLYGATAFSAEAATDYYGCQQNNIDPCPSKQFDTYIGSNPNLDAERSNSWSVGVNYTFLGNWEAALNYFDATIKDSIEYTSAQDQLDVDFNTGGNNPNVTRNSLGGVTRIDAGYQNGSVDFKRTALDFKLSGSYDTPFGTVNGQLNSTRYLTYDSEVSYGTGDLYNAAGSLGFPKWRSNLQLGWNMDSYFANVNFNYIGKSNDRNSSDAYPGWTQINLSLGYDFDKYGTVTVGATNLADKAPVLDSVGGEADQYLYPNTGRVVFARYSVEM